MKNLFDPILTDWLTDFFNRRVSALRNRPNGLNFLQLTKGYLSSAWLGTQSAGVYWLAHEPEEETYLFHWIQVFNVQPSTGNAASNHVLTEHHIVDKHQMGKLSEASVEAVLPFWHSGLLVANLRTNEISLSALRAILPERSALEINHTLHSWHVLWPLHRITLCKDEGQATVFMPSGLNWSQWCCEVAIACGLKGAPLHQAVRTSTKEYLCSFRLAHSSKFLSGEWLYSLKRLIKKKSSSLREFSESLATLEAFALANQKAEQSLTPFDRKGWDVFPSLNQIGNLLCTIPSTSDPNNAMFVELTSDIKNPVFQTLAELKNSGSSERVLSQAKALEMTRQWNPPATSECGVTSSALQEFADELSYFSGGDAHRVGKSLYFNRARLTCIIESEFDSTTKFFE